MLTTHMVSCEAQRVVRWPIALLLLAALPMALGPQAMRLLVGQADHRCMCGMKAGTCGCPECERLERTRQHDLEHPPTYPVVTGKCSSDIATAPPFAVTAVVPAPVEVRQAANLGRAPMWFLLPLQSVELSPPPTPPPRLALSSEIT